MSINTAFPLYQPRQFTVFAERAPSGTPSRATTAAGSKASPATATRTLPVDAATSPTFPVYPMLIRSSAGSSGAITPRSISVDRRLVDGVCAGDDRALLPRTARSGSRSGGARRAVDLDFSVRVFLRDDLQRVDLSAVRGAGILWFRTRCWILAGYRCSIAIATRMPA